MNQNHKLFLFCDLHGHSRTYNAFMYGCRSLELPESTKLFPFILSKINPYFSFTSSKFGGYKFKESTARVCIYKEFKIPAVYTLEASFAGNSNGIIYTPELLMTIGRDICRSLIPYCRINIPFSPYEEKYSIKAKDNTQTNDSQNPNSKIESKPCLLANNWTNELLLELKHNKELLKTGDMSSDNSSGSNSSPSEDNLNEEDMVKIIPFTYMKKRTGHGKQKKVYENSPVRKDGLGLNPNLKQRSRRIESSGRKLDPNSITRIHFQNKSIVKTALIKNEQKKEEKFIDPPQIIMADKATQTDPISTNSLK